MKRVLSALLLFAAMFVVAMEPASANPQLKAAQTCTQESQRLARLACFDEVFGTPLSDDVMPQQMAQQPERWRQAYALELRRKPQDGVLYRDTGTLAGHLATVSALGVAPPRPLLAFQCHNNISELTVMLPQPAAEERLSVDTGQGRQIWRVRDEGFVISGGRGLPAIRSMKALLDQRDVTLASSQSRLDGLVFDLSGLQEALAPLREQCGW